MRTVKFLLTDQTGEVMGERFAVATRGDSSRKAIKRHLLGEEILSLQIVGTGEKARWIAAVTV